MVEDKKGLPVGPSVGPLALDDKQKAQLLTLIQTFTQLDPAGRRRLLRAARELLIESDEQQTTKNGL